MSNHQSVLKNLIFRMLQLSRLDIKSISRRLLMLGARHSEVSAISSISNGTPSLRLWQIFNDLILRVATDCSDVTLLRTRKNVPTYAYAFPGEHYRLLPALVNQIDAKVIIEIGTYTGISASAMLPEVIRNGRKLYSFDILPWQSFENTVLSNEDFSNNFTQIIIDIGELDNLIAYRDIFLSADLIFLDACKDGFFERDVLINFEKLGLRNGTIILFDDIKQWNMIKIWNDINMPKLDITPIGHFTGTGIVEWNNGISCFDKYIN